ncbi:hypothetical protein EVAR_11573_1 [Eumeta japonica]|uniref:Uncharacterized protein n=1 Tax=Eumeta variegata TaxID=151549 RepID=A0A4C1X7R8_EUMVA|nr:hypothetical protein EVAR_11573_1 [Eumeta japonica]
MDSKVQRARKMNTAEQENETSMSAPTSRSSETGIVVTHGPRCTSRGRAYKNVVATPGSGRRGSGDLIDCDNASHLSKTDKLEKRTVTLGDIEPVPESSPTTAPPPPPTACSEISASP